MPLRPTYIYDSWYKRNTWCVPMVPVVDMFAWLEAHASEGFAISGVYGNRDHWYKSNAGDHTNRTTHNLWGVLPASTGKDNVVRRYVGAIDYKLPEGWMGRYETWCVQELRANRAPWVKYMNINGHHYHRESGYAQSSSGDIHAHESFAPGFETKKVPLLVVRFYDEVMHPKEDEDMPLSDDDIKRIWSYKPFPSSHAWLTTAVASGQTYLYLSKDGDLRTRIEGIMAAQAQLAGAIATISSGVAAIDSLDDATRDEVLALKGQLEEVRRQIDVLIAQQEPAPDPQ